MKSALHGAVGAAWDGRGGPAGSLWRLLATPPAWLYGNLVGLRNRRYDRGGSIRIDDVKVISIGNLAVGGTGKTPVAAWLARGLADAGHRPGVVASGYARDEPSLHRRWNPDVPVVSGKDRVRAATAARDLGIDVVILDDGFQHRRLARDLDIVLLAAEDGLCGRLLPAGRLREPKEALRRADAVVVTRRVASVDQADAVSESIRRALSSGPVVRADLIPAGWTTLGGGPAQPPLGGVLVVSAVARPEHVVVGLASRGVRVEASMNFPDHHEYSAADARRVARTAGGRSVVVTEKDAVKLVAHEALLGDVRAVGQELSFAEGERELRGLVQATLAGRGP